MNKNAESLFGRHCIKKASDKSDAYIKYIKFVVCQAWETP